MGRWSVAIAVVAIIAAACSADDRAPQESQPNDGETEEPVGSSQRGFCDVRTPESVANERLDDDSMPPLDGYFSTRTSYARVNLEFEERTRAGDSIDYLVFRGSVEEVLFDGLSDLPSTFRAATTVPADVCPDERLLLQEGAVVAALGRHAFLPGQPDAEWWLAWAWVDVDGSVEYISERRPPAETLTDIYAAFDEVGLQAASETDKLLAWVTERRDYTVPREERDTSRYGPMELALGRHRFDLENAFDISAECGGTGFVAVDREQSRALVVTLSLDDDGDPRDLGEIRRRVDVTDGPWHVEVILGSDLLAGGCPDRTAVAAIGEAEAGARIDHRWTATAGFVEVGGPHANGGAALGISELVVTPPFGGPYELRDIVIRNRCWACDLADPA